jgi:hypothetical protein
MLWALFADVGCSAALLLQTGAEEMLFRGYLQQQTRRAVSQPCGVHPGAVLAIFGLLRDRPSAAARTGCAGLRCPWCCCRACSACSPPI